MGQTVVQINYTFADAASARAFLANTPFAAALRDASPSSVSVQQFAVPEASASMVGDALRSPRSFDEMAAEALAVVPAITPLEAQCQLADHPETLIIDVRDAADVAATGTIPGALNISYGALTYQADHQAPATWRAPQLADHDRPIITTCIYGPLGALGGKLLRDLGFTDVKILAGGVQAWIDAGFTVADHT
jgi:rhodanese-related sulfurtransferase